MTDRRWIGALTTVAAAALGIALWQHVMPPDFRSLLGVDAVAVAELHAALGLHVPAVSPALFSAVFAALLVVAFGAYGILIWRALRPDGPGPSDIEATSWPLWLAATVPIVVCLVMPAALSTDVSAYVGYGRLAVIHGLNPQVASPLELVRLGDPIARTIRWDAPSPYGPIWTLTAIAVVALVPHGSVQASVLVFKLLATAGLLATAAAARRLARDLDPPRADAVFVAIALNPLLLIEGPGSAHNDIIVAFFVVLAFLALHRHRPAMAALAVGVAGAMKLVPFVLLPWLASAAVARPDRYGSGRSWWPRLERAALVVALGLLPLALGYLPLWTGARTFDSIATRWRLGHAVSGGVSLAPVLALGLFGLGSFSIIRAARSGQEAALGVLISLWALLSVPLMSLATNRFFPWYLTWAWSMVALRATRPHRALLLWLLPVSLLLALHYTIRSA